MTWTDYEKVGRTDERVWNQQVKHAQLNLIYSTDTVFIKLRLGTAGGRVKRHSSFISAGPDRT